MQIIRQRVHEIRADATITSDSNCPRHLPQRKSSMEPPVDRPPSIDIIQRIRHGRIHYDQGADDSIDAFLHSFRPSDPTLSKTYQVHWIQCNRPTPTQTQTGVESPLIHSPFEGHLASLSRGDITKDMCVQRLLQEARRQGQLTGKWMVFAPCTHADVTWGKIAKATVEGSLGCSAKVATFDPTRAKQLICVYVLDSSDRTMTGHVLSALQKLGCPTVGYKMDLFTHLGIYRGNKWGLDPCLYRPYHFDQSARR